mmetsp:Transcript_23912/g.94864  ORF Transcript_23912/g.94864 Transcript_23912/m.94864 type:complete len:576 (-) Transcript_23912:160-1887(-)
MEKERGISISSTCLTFEYDAKRVNLMDTPGHADFSEDTYRTLAAADNAVMLVDGGKGLEAQTKKLFAVARRSGLPVFTFVNKLDRPALSPWAVCDEIAEEFALECCVRTWPVGSGDRFCGVYEAATDELVLYGASSSSSSGGAAAKGKKKDGTRRVDASDEDAVRAALAAVDGDLADEVLEDREMIRELTPALDPAKLLNGEQTAVFFGSAMTDAGVAPFLEDFLNIAARPRPRKLLGLSSGAAQSVATKQRSTSSSSSSSGGGGGGGDGPAAFDDDDDDIVASPPSFLLAQPEDPRFAAFVFKLQANLNPRHRDSMAYVRVVSGCFRRGMKVTHGRTGRQLALSQASLLFGAGRDGVDAAFPGDVLGLPNPSGSLLQIGDALVTPNTGACDFEPIPSFSPECFAYVRPAEVGTSQKAFQKGLDQLLAEGAVSRLAAPQRGSSRGSSSSRGSAASSGDPPLLAAVGQLQFDVVQARLRTEYGVETALEPLSYTIARWVRPDDADVAASWDRVDAAKAGGHLGAVFVVEDAWHRPVLLFRNGFTADRLEADQDLDLGLQPWALPPRGPTGGKSSHR